MAIYSVMILLTTTILASHVDAKLCSLRDMKEHAMNACDNLARKIRSPDSHEWNPTVYSYKVLNETENGRRRRDIIYGWKEPFPENKGFIKMNLSHKLYHFLNRRHHLHNNEAENSFDVALLGKYSHEHRRHRHGHSSHEIRKRSDFNALVTYCCISPEDDDCNDHLCFV